MITANGYSKDPSIRPDGIVITWSKEMVDLKGGLRNFVRHFHYWMSQEGTTWLQKCKNKPKFDDLLYVYIIYAGRVRYRLTYVTHMAGAVEINTATGEGSFSNWETISWPRVVMTGPIVRAPRVIKLKGFQGFRYCNELF